METEASRVILLLRYFLRTKNKLSFLKFGKIKMSVNVYQIGLKRKLEFCFKLKKNLKNKMADFSHFEMFLQETEGYWRSLNKFEN